jgi:hypothetical protein
METLHEALCCADAGARAGGDRVHQAACQTSPGTTSAGDTGGPPMDAVRQPGRLARMGALCARAAPTKVGAWGTLVGSAS